MEPVSSCRQTTDGSHLPMSSLWPIPEYLELKTAAVTPTNAQEGPNVRFRQDIHGRLQCTNCTGLFCSSVCKDAYFLEMTSCCQCIHAMEIVLQTLSTNSDNVAIIMASRIFCSLLKNYRTLNNKIDDLKDLCGTASDIQVLELGVQSRDEEGTINFSLLSVYDALCSNVYGMTTQEKSIFSLEWFSRLAAVSARNGFAVRTESPFRPYHAALLRAAGGRGTEKHQVWMKQIAHTLGSEKLQRTMDRDVADLVAAQVVAIFTLAARMNHSCDPNAMVSSGEFVDCHIDVVAKRDIRPGEEITISYINNQGRTSSSQRDRNRRIRELERKYLFTCDCLKCLPKCI